MSLHLAEISQHVAADGHAVVILDQAGWHGAKALRIPDNLSLLPLPPYSPELNPIENLWQFLRHNFLNALVFASYEAVVDACCDAWNRLCQRPDQIRSITTRVWAKHRSITRTVGMRGESSRTDNTSFGVAPRDHPSPPAAPATSSTGRGATWGTPR